MGTPNMQPGVGGRLAVRGRGARRARRRAAWLLPVLLLAWLCTNSGCTLLNTPEPAQTPTPGTPEGPQTKVPPPIPTATPVPAEPADTLADGRLMIVATLGTCG